MGLINFQNAQSSEGGGRQAEAKSSRQQRGTITAVLNRNYVCSEKQNETSETIATQTTEIPETGCHR